MKSKIVIFSLFIILLSSYVYGLFGIPNPPPGVQINQVCLKGQPCTITAPLYVYSDIYMNGYTIYNVTLANVTFSQIIYVNYTQVLNPIWVNKTGDVMTGDLVFTNNNITGLYKIESTLWCDGITCYNLNQLANDTRTYGIGEYLVTTITGETITIELNETRLQQEIDNRQIVGDNNYIYTDSTHHLNDTKLNQTIDNRVSIAACDNSTDIACQGKNNVFRVDQFLVNGTKLYLTNTTTNESFFVYNDTIRRLQLYVNGKLQQEWGNSTYIYGTATFYQDILATNFSGNEMRINLNVLVIGNTTSDYFIGNGTFITDVCHTDGSGCDGINLTIQQLFNQSIYYGDEVYINKVNNTFYLNENKLNQSIRAIADIQSYDYYFNISVIGGYGYSSTPISFSYLITQVTVYPPITPINYRFELNETINGDKIDTDRIPHNGIWDIFKTYSLNSSVTGTIHNSNQDGIFTVRIKYIDNKI